MDYLGTPLEKRKEALNVLMQLHNAGNKGLVLDGQQDGFAVAFLREVDRFHIEGSIASISSRLILLINDPVIRLRIKRASDVLLRIEEAFKTMKGTSHIVFSPLLVYKPDYYKSGPFFTVTVSNPKSTVTVAAGGRYDSLIRRYTSVIPSLLQKKFSGAGMLVSLTTLVQLQLNIKSDQDKLHVQSAQVSCIISTETLALLGGCSCREYRIRICIREIFSRI